MKGSIIPIIIFLASFAIFSFQAHVIGLEFKGDENFYFQSAREMLESGNWVTPYYFKKPRFEKPILYYWLVASSFKFFGINWRVARLPSAISMTLVVVFTYLFGKALFNKEIALLSTVVITTSLATFRYARLILPEAFFLLLLAASLYLLLKKRYFWAYLLMGLSFLTKGPVGLVLPIFIMAGYSYAKSEGAFFKKIRVAEGLFIALLIGLPWYILMIKLHGRPYLDHIFFRETIKRIGVFQSGALLHFIPVTFIFYLPWSLCIAPFIRDVSVCIAGKGSNKDGPLFSFIWFFAILIFFTFLGEKHRHYMLALSVPFSLMAGNYFYNIFASKRAPKMLFIFIFFILSFFIFESAKLAISKEIDGIGAIFLNRTYDIEPGDIVGIGTHSIVPQELEIYTNHPVEKFCYKWPKELQAECDRENMIALNQTLFREGNSSYLLIKKDDFLRYITPETKKRLTILEKGYMYNKDVEPSRILRSITRFNKESLLDLFREEVYFVTNKRM